MKTKVISLTLILTLLLLLFGCSVDKIDTSSISNEEIKIVGVKDEDFEITVKDLAKLECISKTTHSTSDKIGTVRATGPLLDTFLERYGKKQTDYDYIEFTGRDGYIISLDKKFLSENKVILAFGIDGKSLPKSKAPIRIVIPKSDSAYWVNQVVKIEFIDK